VALHDKNEGDTMSEEATAVVEAEAGEAQEAQPSAGTQITESAPTEHMIPKSRFDEVNAELRKIKQAQTQATKAQEEAQRKAAEEQGEYKRLYEEMSQKMAQAQQRAEELERQQLRARVAQTVGIPAALADRLRGDTEEEIAADAKTLLDTLPKPQAPNINASPGTGATPRTDLGGMSPEEFAAVYGVNPRFIQA
jgi:hypothetical protein